ncbi:MtrAB system accessory lipoprotein LpqB [Corynebacterium caspium]|uniref:MtrAB system accessory lipoprotein LpqB n=1 Tax=Corynebacterium caspium TaxID=234828 RepID=UPI00036EAE38|nr:MtrAB system accessory lipoprotein LpqB [Corynebacterium caspium]WKD59712.1 Lipoprotein LpqB precursor [Corynebacterium caspium DSM 44850]
MFRYSRLQVGIGALLSGVVLASCSTLPLDSDPQALRSFVADIPTEPALAPVDGRAPDLLLRDFYIASARPTQDYQAARAFLTDAAAEKWKTGDSDSTLIVERIDINSQPGLSDGTRTFDVSGQIIGRLDSDGAYVPGNGLYEGTIEMRLQGNQWRISQLPAGVVLERTELRNYYEPHQLRFFEPSGRILVGDRRWIYSGQSNLDTVLINLLLQGPSHNLERGVVSMVPSTASFVGFNNGVYEFAGMGDLTPAQRILFGAQLVWTLADAGISGPYSVILDGLPLGESFQSLTTDDFAGFNPALSTAAVSSLYVLRNGNLMRVGSSGLEVVSGAIGRLNNLESADLVAGINAGGMAALVRPTEDNEKAELYIGSESQELSKIIDADTLSRPSFEFDSTGLWIVLDGHEVLRVVKSPTTGEFARARVKTAALDDIAGDIKVLRLSPSGVRVAMIIDDRVYVGVVEQTSTGERRIVNISEIAPALNGTARSLDWHPDGSLIVGTSSMDTPVWRVEQDGAGMVALPAGNITAPVTAVAATTTTIYLTDALAIRQISIGDETDNTFWREVPGLQGQRVSPVVAH